MRKKMLIILLSLSIILSSNLFALNVNADSGESYVVTIWTTDKNFVQGLGAPQGPGTTYLTEMKKFYEKQNATANIIDGGHLSQDSLNGTNLLWVFLPNINFTQNDVEYMGNFLETGGRIVFCGEHPGFFLQGDRYISQAIASLGGDFTILPDMHKPTSGIITGSRLDTGSPLTNGVTGFYFAAAAIISYSGATQVVLNALDDLPLAVDQAVGKGRITLFTDINIWDGVVRNQTDRGNNEVLFANLMKDAKQNQDKVDLGKDPNAGFGLKAEAPTANPNSGATVTSGSAVTLSTTTTEAALHYTLDSTTPSAISTSGSSITLVGEVGSQVVIKAITIKKGMNNSDVATFTYTIAAPITSKVEAPTANPNSGAVVKSGSTVTLSTITTEAAIHYTLDLTTPSAISTSGSSITLVGEVGSQVVIKAIAIKKGMNNSDVATFTYTIAAPITPKAEAPTANLNSGAVVKSGSVVTLSTTTTEAAIHYTLDSTTPSAISTSGSAITLIGEVGSQIVIKAIAIKKGMNNSDVATFTYTIAAPAFPPSQETTSSSNEIEDKNVPVLVNGVIVNAGIQTNGIDKNGNSLTTVTVDMSLIKNHLDLADKNATITVPITGDQQVKECILTGHMIKAIESKASTLEIKTDKITYVLPADQINIDTVAKQFGSDIKLQDLKIIIKIENVSGQSAKIVENAAKKGNFSIVVAPVAFTVQVEYKGKSVEINKFSSFIKRIIEIPNGVDPNKITTGIVENTDETVRHVPTKIIIANGRYYAEINSLTNSTYSVIWHPYEFNDVQKHWAKEAVNDMGARMVVSGVSNGVYEPDRAITRGEVATIIVKALGLAPGTGDNKFSDVNSSALYCEYIKTATAYGIIAGYGNGKFGPNDVITREQAMSMINKAMEITKLDCKMDTGEADSLLADYKDPGNISEYAKKSIAACVKTGIMHGRSNKYLAPADTITRAEVAVLIRNLLKKSNLI